MPEHVLIPFDGSPLARQALSYACAEFGESEITVVYVVDQRSDETASKGWGDHPDQWEEWLRDRRNHAEELFADARDVADNNGVAIETAVAVGRVSEMILDAVDEYGADLLVVGAHGKRSFEEFLVGDVAETLVRRSPVPVLTVRQRVDG